MSHGEALTTNILTDFQVHLTTCLRFMRRLLRKSFATLWLNLWPFVLRISVFISGHVINPSSKFDNLTTVRNRVTNTRPQSDGFGLSHAQYASTTWPRNYNLDPHLPPLWSQDLRSERSLFTLTFDGFALETQYLLSITCSFPFHQIWQSYDHLFSNYDRFNLTALVTCAVSWDQ